MEYPGEIRNNHAIVGMGEVGLAISMLLRENPDFFTYHYDIDIAKESENDLGSGFKGFHAMHVCFPWNNIFPDEVDQWRRKIAPEIVIIHSTVRVGTSSRVGAVHSPVNGRHPYILKGLKTFTKYFGGKESNIAAGIFSSLIPKIVCYESSGVTEAMKLWSTTQYGLHIMIQKEIYDWCKMNNLPFEEVYTRSNIDYNEGYSKLLEEKFVRPYLDNIPGPIGGHCVIPNLDLLEDSKLVTYLKKMNRLWKEGETCY